MNSFVEDIDANVFHITKIWLNFSDEKFVWLNFSSDGWIFRLKISPQTKKSVISHEKFSHFHEKFSHIRKIQSFPRKIQSFSSTTLKVNIVDIFACRIMPFCEMMQNIVINRRVNFNDIYLRSDDCIDVQSWRKIAQRSSPWRKSIYIHMTSLVTPTFTSLCIWFKPCQGTFLVGDKEIYGKWNLSILHGNCYR